MIIDLAVKNFLSIKDEQLFSMHADRNLTHLAENLAHLDTNYATVRTSAILGSNASGKTNLLFAIKAIVHIVCDRSMFFDYFWANVDVHHSPRHLGWGRKALKYFLQSVAILLPPTESQRCKETCTAVCCSFTLACCCLLWDFWCV